MSYSSAIMEVNGLKKLQLPVSDSFVVPDDRLLSDSGFVEEVLLTGVKVVKDKMNVESLHTLDERSKVITHKYEEKLAMLTAENKRKLDELVKISDGKEEEICDKRQRIQQLQSELNESRNASYEKGRVIGMKAMKELLEREKRELEERKAELREKNIEIQRLRDENHQMTCNLLTEVKDMSNRVDTVHNIFHKDGRKGLSANEIGEMGQEFVQDWIENNFNPARVHVAASTPHSADLHFEHEGTNILIEVKNKKKLDRTEDLKKFHNDIEIHAKHGHTYTAALLVNLQDTTLIHGYKGIYFEVKHGMPVIYVGGVVETPTILTYAITLLSMFARSGNFSDDDSAEDDSYECALSAHKRTAIQFINMIRQMQEDIIKDRKALAEQEARVNARERSLNDFVTYQTELVRQFPMIEEEAKSVDPTVGASKRTVNKESILAWIRSQKEKVSENTLIKYFGISRHQLRELGGIIKLRDEASVKLMDT